MEYGFKSRFYTIKHILLDCKDLADTRRHFYESVDLFNLFKMVTKEKSFGLSDKSDSTTKYKTFSVLDPSGLKEENIYKMNMKN